MSTHEHSNSCILTHHTWIFRPLGETLLTVSVLDGLRAVYPHVAFEPGVRSSSDGNNTAGIAAAVGQAVPPGGA